MFTLAYISHWLKRSSKVFNVIEMRSKMHFRVGIPTNTSLYPSLAKHEWKTASPRFFSAGIERKVSSSVCYSSIGDPISIPLLLFLA